MKILFSLLLVLLVTSVVFAIAGIMATWAPDRSVSQLSTRDDPMPILLLHGTSASLHTWEGWAEVLKGQRRVIRFDMPGFGLTGPAIGTKPEWGYSEN